MNKVPFISIIVVAYNYENFLPRCFDAIIEQDFEDFEIVIVDNGSTDSTADVIKKYIEKYQDINFRYITVEKNIGLPNGRNKGIEAATGEYILFNDADDWMDKSCLKILAQRAKETNADKVVGGYSEIDTDGKILREITYPDDFSYFLNTALQGMIFKRKYFEEHNISVPLETKMDDGYINFTFYRYGKHVEYVSDNVFFYYVNPYSTSGTKTNNPKWNTVSMLKDYIDVLWPLRYYFNDKEKEEFGYALIKQYYNYLFHYNRYMDKKLAIKNYHESKNILIENYDRYYKNRLIVFFKKNGDRKSGRILVWLMCKADRWHFMGVILRMYIRLSQKRYLVP